MVLSGFSRLVCYIQYSGGCFTLNSTSLLHSGFSRLVCYIQYSGDRHVMNSTSILHSVFRILS